MNSNISLHYAIVNGVPFEKHFDNPPYVYIVDVMEPGPFVDDNGQHWLGPIEGAHYYEE